MSIIVDLLDRQIGAALARQIEPDQPGTAFRARGAGSPDGAEIILFPRRARSSEPAARKPLKRRFAVKAQPAAEE